MAQPKRNVALRLGLFLCFLGAVGFGLIYYVSSQIVAVEGNVRFTPEFFTVSGQTAGAILGVGVVLTLIGLIKRR